MICLFNVCLLLIKLQKRKKMVRITEELVRKKSEHNELMISTLEELSLHQEDIEKIEHLQNMCRDLKILLLQNNLIAKVENLHKLKRLEYLNLAINNIERIENLEKLESLEKLDLTLNFIGEITSIENLKENYNLRSLILTGNPCTDYPGYREFVITVLPQIKLLDCTEITITERLIAKQNYNKNRNLVLKRQIDYRFKRDEQKIRVASFMVEQEREMEHLNDEEKLQKFWNTNSEHCPEIRVEIANKSRESRKQEGPPEQPEKPKRKLFSDAGRPYCINEPKLEYEFLDEPDRFELNLHVYKFLDTSLIEADVQVNYIRVTVKGKIFQIGLNDEIKIEESTSKRSAVTGHLLVVMPKLKYDHAVLVAPAKLVQKKLTKSKEIVGTVDYKHIVKHSKEKDEVLIIDDSEVPPLI